MAVADIASAMPTSDRAARGQRQARQRRRAPITAAVTANCASPSPKMSRRMASSVRELQLEPDDEEQQHDAELGHAAHRGGVGEQPEPGRADGEPRREIADDGAEPQRA